MLEQDTAGLRGDLADLVERQHARGKTPVSRPVPRFALAHRRSGHFVRADMLLAASRINGQSSSSPHLPKVFLKLVLKAKTSSCVHLSIGGMIGPELEQSGVNLTINALPPKRNSGGIYVCPMR